MDEIAHLKYLKKHLWAFKSLFYNSPMARSLLLYNWHSLFLEAYG